MLIPGAPQAGTTSWGLGVKEAHSTQHMLSETPSGLVPVRRCFVLVLDREVGGAVPLETDADTELDNRQELRA